MREKLFGGRPGLSTAVQTLWKGSVRGIPSVRPISHRQGVRSSGVQAWGDASMSSPRYLLYFCTVSKILTSHGPSTLRQCLVGVLSGELLLFLSFLMSLSV